MAKSLLKQFKLAKKTTSDLNGDDKTFLNDLADGIDLEDAETRAQAEVDGDQDKDNTDGFINELAEMNAL